MPWLGRSVKHFLGRSAERSTARRRPPQVRGPATSSSAGAPNRANPSAPARAITNPATAYTLVPAIGRSPQTTSPSTAAATASVATVVAVTVTTDALSAVAETSRPRSPANPIAHAAGSVNRVSGPNPCRIRAPRTRIARLSRR